VIGGEAAAPELLRPGRRQPALRAEFPPECPPDCVMFFSQIGGIGWQLNPGDMCFKPFPDFLPELFLLLGVL
jgi:hypothetical protein